MATPLNRSSRAAMADARCRSRSCCPTAAASRCRRRPRSRSSRARATGLRALARPAMGSLARAYVHDDLDFPGSARRDARDRRGDGRRRRARPRRRSRARLQAVAAPAPQQPREHRVTTTTSATRSTGCGSTSAWCTRARTSSATTMTLDDAQVAKLDHICRKLRLAPGERFLDIGCGWGALILHAAREATACTRPASRCRRTSTST